MKPIAPLRNAALCVATAAALLAVLPALADDPAGSHESHHPADAAAAAPVAAAPADASAPMMDRMKEMQDQMAKIRAAKDPKVRAALLDEHLKAMQDTMKLMMDGKGGCPMMGGAHGSDPAAGPGGMMDHHQMMQMMMDQMMQHQDMMQGPGK